MTTTADVFVRGRLNAQQLHWFRQALRLVYGAVSRVQYYHLENVPATGGFIAAANHLSWFDSPMVFMALPERRFTIFGADKYRGHWLFDPIMSSVDLIWVQRGATPPSAIKAALNTIKDGNVLGIAPEGTRSRVTHALQQGKSGTAFFALSTGAPVVPIALTGTDRIVHDFYKRPVVTATFGKPLQFTSAPGQRERATAERLEAVTHEIMCQLAALLPPRYRGVYANDPRVAELLAVSL
jgi:1-acyl-sn-glycerol-3-phosphate acyltransferase